MTDFFGPPIDSYSRAEAIDDGVLVDVTASAREVGFRFPVALTRAAYEEHVAWADVDNAKHGTLQQEPDRLRHVLEALRLALPCTNDDEPEVRFSVRVVPHDGNSSHPTEVALKALCGPGDDAAPVITIMLPDED